MMYTFSTLQKTGKNGNHLSPVEKAVPRKQAGVVMITSLRFLRQRNGRRIAPVRRCSFSFAPIFNSFLNLSF